MGCGVSKQAPQKAADSPSAEKAPEAEYAPRGDALPPIEMLLEQATAAKAALGPLLLEADKLKAELKEGFDQGSDHASVSAFMSQKVTKRFAETKEAIESAKARLMELRVAAAERIGMAAADNALAYAAALDAADIDNGRDDFARAVQQCTNTGELKEGHLVEIQDNLQMRKAKVLRKCEDHCYELSLFVKVQVSGEEYEEGYETRKPVHTVCPRHLIYANQKQEQQLSTVPAGGSVKPTDVHYLMHLLANAYDSNQRLHFICPQVAARVNAKLGRQAVRAVNSPLKKTQRIMEKVAEKYEGSFAKVCDVARMTFECDDFVAARMTLIEVHTCDEFELTLIKDRMMREFDAKETGGYADALLNARDLVNGHIVEMQITLSSLLTIKKGGGHAEYKLARVLELNDEATYKFQGTLTSQAVEHVRCGLLKELYVTGGFEEHFDELVAALAAPTCLVHNLNIAEAHHNDAPERLLVDFLTHEVLTQLRPRLKYVSVHTLGGVIPETLYTCTQLAGFNFAQSPVIGALSPMVGKLVNLRSLYLWDSKMSGPIPKARPAQEA